MVLRKTGKWDIRCSQELIDLFPNRKGYYFRVDKDQAIEICRILSRDYGIDPPNISVTSPEYRNAEYEDETETIGMRPRNHIRSIFHEFYHHLDNMTKNKYDSSDDYSYAWKFAKRLWILFATKTPNYPRRKSTQLRLF